MLKHEFQERDASHSELCKRAAALARVLCLCPLVAVSTGCAHPQAGAERASTVSPATDGLDKGVVRGVIRGHLDISYPFNFTPGDPIPVVAGSHGALAVDVTFLDGQVLVHRSTDANAFASNGLIAITESGLLLIDTSWTDSQTEAILRWGDEKLKKPWIGAVVTHDHVDRAGGIGALLRRGIPVAALDLTVAKLAARGIHNVATLFTAKAGEFRDPRGFEAFYPGPGHSSDNIVVRVDSVLFAGCFLKSSDAKDLGSLAAADLPAWPASVRRLRDKFGPMTIVPGHGSWTGAAYQHTLDLLGAEAK